MSDLILPPGYNRTPVQLTENICVLVHHDTKRILCFCFDDVFAKTFESRGYEKIPINHAHEYDKWAKRWREQSKIDNEIEDAAYLEREARSRKVLRDDLRKCLSRQTTGAGRMAIESALRALDAMEQRRIRYRESFQMREAYDDTNKDAAEAVTRKIILNE